MTSVKTLYLPVEGLARELDGKLLPALVARGCGRDTVPLAAERWYDFPEFGGYLGRIG